MEKAIVTENTLIIEGVEIDVNFLIKHALFIKKGNTKTEGKEKKKRVWSFGTLFGCIPHEIPELGIHVFGTCGTHCSGCFNKDNWRKSPCYVAKSYYQNISRETGYCSVRYGHALRTLALRYYTDRLIAALKEQLRRAKKKPDIIRINVSGEIETIEQFKGFCEIAASIPSCNVYIYSKNYDVVIPALLNGIVPANFTVNISIWHEYGISEYNLVKHLDNVKAFVYDDHDFDYFAAGLIIDTYCKAYDEKGKMDHSVTCDICTKCFNRCSGCKCIGCNSH